MSTAFRASLARPRATGSPRLGGKTDEQRARRAPPRASELREDVGGSCQPQLQRAVRLLDFLAGLSVDRRVVGHRGGHDDDVGRAGGVVDGILHLRRAADADDLDPSGGGSGVGPDTSTTRAPRRAASAASA